MNKVPSAIWVVDTKKEHLAVDEAKKLGIPVIAILDTNCDPDDVDFPIPGNDDAIRSVSLLTRVFADAVAEGLLARGGAKTGDEEAGSELGGDEPLAEWERELLTTTEAAPADPKDASGEAAGGDSVAEAPAADDVPAPEAPEGATATQPYGPGSKAPLKSGNAPKGFAIKAIEGSKTYVTEASESYEQTVAEVWFETEEAAQAAGFRQA
jgi:small subunit ribosomal protein S2